jgi:hypothetical protein
MRYISPITLLFQIVERYETKGCRIDAIPQACGRRPIRKNVAEMRISIFTPELGSNHPKTSIFNFHDIFRIQGPGKTWPPGSGHEFVL